MQMQFNAIQLNSMYLLVLQFNLLNKMINNKTVMVNVYICYCNKSN